MSSNKYEMANGSIEEELKLGLMLVHFVLLNKVITWKVHVISYFLEWFLRFEAAVINKNKV